MAHMSTFLSRYDYTTCASIYSVIVPLLSNLTHLCVKERRRVASSNTSHFTRFQFFNSRRMLRFQFYTLFFFSQLNSKLEWTNLYADFRAFYLHPQSILVIRNFEQIQWACFIPSFAYIYTSISTFLTFEIRSCRKVLKNSFNGPKEFSCRKTIYSISFDWFTHGDSVEPTVICWLLGLVRLFVRSFLRSFIHLPKMQTD